MDRVYTAAVGADAGGIHGNGCVEAGVVWELKLGIFGQRRTLYRGTATYVELCSCPAFANKWRIGELLECCSFRELLGNMRIYTEER